jgi:hypothetical protein
MRGNKRRKVNTVAGVDNGVGRNDATAERGKLLIRIAREDAMHDSDVRRSQTLQSQLPRRFDKSMA